jgi:redox-sensitive bicupin YhaK (pirin superfamily)
LKWRRLFLIVIPGRPRDLGDGFIVSRVLPSAQRCLVGPFIFFDYLGPVLFNPGNGIDVRPHPHIGLATVTYLFEGALVHRDSLGSIQTIEPGDVNWMTAGRGIVHSERTGPEVRAAGHRLHGIQSWIALPKTDEECDPGFHHFSMPELPSKRENGVFRRIIAGRAYGLASPVRIFSKMFYLDLQFDAGGDILLPDEFEERAIFVVDGALEASGTVLAPGSMTVFDAGDMVHVSARTKSRAMLLGGMPMDGSRHIYWNFVASSKERIERAKTDWRENRFGQVPGETEFIPLPND